VLVVGMNPGSLLAETWEQGSVSRLIPRYSRTLELETRYARTEKVNRFIELIDRKVS
jgi:hypothetical protein